jgi:hypothetical protein
MAEVIATPRDCFEESCQLPSKGLTGNGLAPLTPGNIAGSLLISQAVQSEEPVFYPEGIDKRPRAPSDEETGAPLALVPYLGMDTLPTDDTNTHHGIYPENHERLKSLGGKALRVSRLQVVPGWLHNGDSKTAFHTIYGDGIEIPETISEQAGLVAILAAGFIPELVVDTSKEEPIVRIPTAEERAFLTKTGQPTHISGKTIERFQRIVMPKLNESDVMERLTTWSRLSADRRYRGIYYGANQVTEFLRSFVIEQDISAFNRKLMRKFIKYGEPDVGMTLLGQAAVAASEEATVKGVPFRQVYRGLWLRGLVNVNMSYQPADYLVSRLGSPIGRALLMPLLRECLSNAQEMVA